MLVGHILLVVIVKCMSECMFVKGRQLNKVVVSEISFNVSPHGFNYEVAARFDALQGDVPGVRAMTEITSKPSENNMFNVLKKTDSNTERKSEIRHYSADIAHGVNTECADYTRSIESKTLSSENDTVRQNKDNANTNDDTQHKLANALIKSEETDKTNKVENTDRDTTNYTTVTLNAEEKANMDLKSETVESNTSFEKIKAQGENEKHATTSRIFGGSYSKSKSNSVKESKDQIFSEITMEGENENIKLNPYAQIIGAVHPKSETGSTKNGNKKPVPDAKIVGGTFSSPDSWPWLASIQYLGIDCFWHHFCGGSLISDGWVVTAAHCVTQLENRYIRVVLGDYQLSDLTHREQVIDPERILRHAFYEATNYHYDIAMIKLRVKANETAHVQPVPMSTKKIDSFDYCYIAGWGKTKGSVVSDYLQESLMSVISRSECRQVYGNTILDTQICVYSDHASACTGDSGGPLVCAVNYGWALAGVASWVGSSTCQPYYPNVFTRISSFVEWTEAVMAIY